MPADPTQTVPPSQHLPTTPGDIGHVAPDFSNRRHFNTLVIRPELRISLRLGRFNDLCPDAVSTPRGRQQRLQLLGYLYEPFNSPNLASALNTVFQWYTGELGRTEADLEAELESGIVENGRLPAPGEFAKVFFPGGFCINANNLNEALGSPTGHPAGTRHVKFRTEQAVWDNNELLGCIPLIATVERRSQDDLQWRPVEGAVVHLQLLPPDDLPDDQKPPPMRSTNLTPAPPSPPSNPDTYVTTRIANPPGVTAVANDPQVDNCHRNFGGKRGFGNVSDGSDVAHAGRERIFKISAQPGFHTAHPTRPLEHAEYNVPQQVTPAGTQHAHSVKATTNAEGEAGFIFTPSRIGGDRYKLRAYVGPPTLPSDGTDIRAVSVDTGTFVVWRRIRFAKYLVWDYPSGYTQPSGPPPPTDTSTWTRRQELDFRVRNMGSINLNNVAFEFQKAYCHVTVETTAARTLITSAQWTAARNHAVANFATVATFIANVANLPTNIDLNAMFPATPFTDNPSIFRVADRATYNANKGSAFPTMSAAVYNNSVGNLVRGFLNAFMHFFTRDALPFVVIQSPFGDSITFNGVDPTGGGGAFTRYITTSGEATCCRGCYLWWGSAFYNVFAYPGGVDHNTVHEAGHCHFGAHQFTGRDSSGAPAGAAAMLPDHDQHDFCVMGYLQCQGDFCGRCLLKLRGWDALAVPAN
jgi:hypothetical protein